MSTKSKTTGPSPKASPSKTPSKVRSAPTKSSKQRRAEVSVASGSKLDQIQSALATPDGTTIEALMSMTGWQAHSVRGALAGTLKVKRKLAIGSEVRDGVRFYRIEGAQ